MIARQITDRLHVLTSWRGVIRAIRKGMRKRARVSRKWRRARHEAYRAALARHQANRRLFNFVMVGKR